MLIDENSIPFFKDVFQYYKDHLVMFIVIFTLIGIFIYSVTAVFLNKLNKEMYGKTTWMAWVPIFRIFLLGKLAIHWIVGIILVLGLPCTISITIITNGVGKDYAILPDNIREPFMIVYIALVIALYVFAHIKLSNIRVNGKGYSSKTYVDDRVTTEYNQKYMNKVPNEQVLPVNNKPKSPEDDFYSSMNTETKTNEEKQPMTLQDLLEKQKIDKKP